MMPMPRVAHRMIEGCTKLGIAEPPSLPRVSMIAAAETGSRTSTQCWRETAAPSWLSEVPGNA
jgi:hypothetical protein